MPLRFAKERPLVLLGVCGGIAAYKACEVLRQLQKSGCDVRVLLTESAESFIGPLTFAALSGAPVITAAKNSASSNVATKSAFTHIDLARQADLFLIVPATANILAKLAHGLADDPVTTEALAVECPLLIAPAMNSRMWSKAIVRENLAILRERGVEFVEPVAGELACGEVGEGKLADIEAIVARALILLDTKQSKPLSGLKVLVNSGPTRSWIDSVRFISNRSSGKMGHALGKAAQEMGAEVVFVTGPVAASERTIPGAKNISVDTTAEMLSVMQAESEFADWIIATAAVADFSLPAQRTGKLERASGLQLNLEPTVDIIAQLAANRRPEQKLIGFAAEAASDGRERARLKLQRKGLDVICFNDVSRPDIGFDARENELSVIFRELPDNPVLLKKAPKTAIARELLAVLARKFIFQYQGKENFLSL